MRRFGTGGALAALLLAGCGISSDPITGDADGGLAVPDAGGPAGRTPPWDEIADYAGCDVDLACSEGCVAPDFDPDCEIVNLIPPGERRPPAADGLEALGPAAVAATLEADSEAWWSLGTTAEPLVGLAEVEAGAASLAAFDAGGRLLARAVPRDDGLLVLRVPPRDGDPAPVLLRAAAGGEGAAVRVRRPPSGD
jgi:hypothetical protein